MMMVNITNPGVADTKMLLSEAPADLAVRSWLQLLLLSDSEQRLCSPRRSYCLTAPTILQPHDSPRLLH